MIFTKTVGLVLIFAGIVFISYTSISGTQFKDVGVRNLFFIIGFLLISLGVIFLSF